MPIEEPLICFQKVSKSFGNTEVLIEADFDIETGEPLCIVGPNGGGKTTLLKLILGLEEPDVGSIMVMGDSPRKSRGQIGYMPQYLQFNAKFPITVQEVVEMGLTTSKKPNLSKNEYENSINNALTAVEMSEFADRQFSTLSGGQKQRVLIARAIVSKPSILLLDEPTANLDLTLEDRLLETLNKFHPAMKIIMVSHDLGFVSGAVKQVLCVNRQVHTHPTESISAALIEELYGSSPRRIIHGHDLEHGHHH